MYQWEDYENGVGNTTLSLLTIYRNRKGVMAEMDKLGTGLKSVFERHCRPFNGGWLTAWKLWKSVEL
jgi:hypothetical protein